MRKRRDLAVNEIVGVNGHYVVRREGTRSD
jgi:hypothetical protein